MAHTYGGILGLVAFATVVARGVLWGGGTVGTMLTGCLAMFALAGVGWVVGMVAEATVEESVRTQLRAEVAAYEAQQKQAGRGG